MIWSDLIWRACYAVLYFYAISTPGMKALSIAKETFVRINQDGIACVQHQIETSRGQEIFLDFLMISDETLQQQEDDEDNDNDGED